jgi:hypothetical protein
VEHDASQRQRQRQDEEAGGGRGVLSKVEDLWIHGNYHLRLMAWSMGDEYRHFTEWWKDPERFSVVNADR